MQRCRGALPELGRMAVVQDLGGRSCDGSGVLVGLEQGFLCGVWAAAASKACSCRAAPSAAGATAPGGSCPVLRLWATPAALTSVLALLGSRPSACTGEVPSGWPELGWLLG